jgi:predicted nucleic acid-binding protein
VSGSFIDTNVLIYLASADADKAARAEAVLAQGDAIVSVQVLTEIANVTRRKMHFSWAETREFLGLVRGLVQVTPVTPETHDRGLELAERFGLSIYDAMIAGAALDANCHTLWSEDMQHGLKLSPDLRIANPFA